MSPLIVRPEWLFDGSPIADPFGYGERAVQWLRRNRHPKNPAPGHPFQLDEWQERIIRAIFGPRNPDGTRIIKKVVIQLGRGSRKTALAAAIVLLCTFGPEKIPGGLIQSAAFARKQARELFEEVALIVSQDRRYDKSARVKDYKSQIVNKSIRARYEAISSQGLGHHGSTPNVIVADELHAWTTEKHRELWRVLSSAADKTDNSLMVVLTTAGRGHETLAYKEVYAAKQIQLGAIHDPHVLPVIFEASADADWSDEANWHKLLPGLKSGYPSLQALRERKIKAGYSVIEREILQQLYLGVWQNQSASPFVDMATYDRCGTIPVDFDALAGKPCFIGVDLSEVSDLTAIVAAWPAGDGGYIIRPWYFCPADNLARKSRTEGVNYAEWTRQGFIIPTPGNAVDYAFVEQEIRRLCKAFDVRQIAFDPWRAQKTQQNLMDDGLPVVDFRQGFISMSPACDEVERAIVTGKLYHAGNPILRWNFDNVAVVYDAANNRKFDKSRSRDKIDGAVATLMAVRFAALNDARRSIHDMDPEEEDQFWTKVHELAV
ncbi:phage terminase large subunit-like protein [Bosea robiniae]|uniref:terminase large subunit n=1 Tax=Bosea TaxID=85413 RepID=UPI00285ADB6B|nr:MULTISPECIES: terminase TerL endonuclease subunit [Bosea]MDR6831335.1 phage terminase large subunit-like protein [Bosea robiniae]MDR6898097.1 phage terminase large subunit-like protein [Bosea sp. BE109]MDR7141472.1 phage terminase large subunit-like protein [Bosea sp. BE168]